MEFMINPILSVDKEIGLYLCTAGIMFIIIQITTMTPVMSRHPKLLLVNVAENNNAASKNKPNIHRQNTEISRLDILSFGKRYKV